MKKTNTKNAETTMKKISIETLRCSRCPELRCREDGPAIRFPFRLKDRQPDHHCGYPGFDLYCSHNNDTVLELPTSVKVFVTFINYTHLFLEAAIDNCFPREIPGLNLSSSVFQKVNYPLEDSTLFNWPPETETDEGNPYRIDCLSNSSHSVYAFSSYDSIYHLPIVLCTKMYSVSVPYDIRLSFLGLTWSEPAECGSCEQKGKKCRFGNNSTDLKTECFDPNKDDKHKGIVLFLSNFHFYNHTSPSRFKPTCIDFIKLSRSTKIVIIGELFVGHLKIYNKLFFVLLTHEYWHQVDRPSMKIVVQMLGGEGDKLTIPPNHFTSIGPTRINASMSVRRPNQELEVIPKSELIQCLTQIKLPIRTRSTLMLENFSLIPKHGL
ncbi:putative ring-h2 finger protein atl21a [Quercus suber]|uniref:RING-type E3 ubiquitin transferase n=1 Tax=Quercus suber TaxID=58331 RepID=A0AAW0IMD4_QUESU